MNLAIVGYGKMGRMIESLAPEYGFTPALILDVHNNTNFEGLTEENFRGIHAAVEFSVPSVAVENARRLAALRIPAVMGTTGWLDRLDEVRAAVEEHDSALVWSANFSIGVNIFHRVLAEAAKLFERHPEYGAWGWEIHHHTKKDAPSGTMLQLVRTIREAGYSHPLDVSSNRAGAHPGSHEIGFDAGPDTITLRHTARSREGFARGALKAAQWIAGKTGFYEFKDVLFSG
jgi:4-hydroxy-tetrahydrodipicolinate reductase